MYIYRVYIWCDIDEYNRLLVSVGVTCSIHISYVYNKMVVDAS
jgi:hypothetical protein